MTQDEVASSVIPSEVQHSSGDGPGSATVSDVFSGDLSAQQDTVRERVAKAAAQKVVAHPSIEERRRKGRVAQAETPHEELRVWEPAGGRADPVALLEGQETSRVQELVPVRHTRMATSAFAFYRGAALLMASDLATMSRTGLQVQLCGDAHLSNFGLFAAPDRSVVFDVNDFDETNPGPFEWDVKRLATSFVLAARDNGLAKKAGPAAAEAAAASYPRCDGQLCREGRAGDLVRPHRRRHAGRFDPGASRQQGQGRDQEGSEAGGGHRGGRGERRACATHGRRSRRSPRWWTAAAASGTSPRCWCAWTSTPTSPRW